MKITTKRLLLDHPHVVIVTVERLGKNPMDALVHTLPNGGIARDYTHPNTSVDTLLYAETASSLGIQHGYGHIVCESGAAIVWCRTLSGTDLMINGNVSKEAVHVFSKIDPGAKDAIAIVMSKVPREIHRAAENAHHLFIPGDNGRAKLQHTERIQSLEEVEAYLSTLQENLPYLNRARLSRNTSRATIEDLQALCTLFPAESGITFSLGAHAVINAPSRAKLNDICTLLPEKLISHEGVVNLFELLAFTIPEGLPAQITDICTLEMHSPKSPTLRSPEPYTPPPWTIPHGTAPTAYQEATLTQLARVREMLTIPRRVPGAINDDLVDALTAYGGIDAPVTPEPDEDL